MRPKSPLFTVISWAQTSPFQNTSTRIRMVERTRRSLLPQQIPKFASKQSESANATRTTGSKQGRGAQGPSLESVTDADHPSDLVSQTEDLSQRTTVHFREEKTHQAPTRSYSTKAILGPSRQQPQPQLVTNSVPDRPILGHRRNYSLQPDGTYNPSRSRQGDQWLPSKPRRPQFTAYQQHFSPKKPNTASSQNPPQESSVDVSVAGKLFDLQAEVAYLHLLHQPAASIHKQWVDSAQRLHEIHFQNLAERQKAIERRHGAQRTQHNETALNDWVQRFTNLEASRQVKSLSSNISFISELFQPTGKYSRAIDVFKSWYVHAEEVRHCRSKDDIAKLPNLDFIDDLGDGWHAEMTQLERKLNVCARDLYMLGDLEATSDVATVITLCRTAAEGMLDEVRLTRAIEQGIMAQEREWISSGIGNLVP